MVSTIRAPELLHREAGGPRPREAPASSSCHSDFDFDDPNRQRQALFRANLETANDCFVDVRERFGLRRTLTHTAVDRRARGDDDSGLVSFQHDGSIMFVW